jgi:ATP-dependent RNA helicase DDX55/SPB4
MTDEEFRRKRKKNEAWSDKLEKEEVRVERREKRRKRREAEMASKMTAEERMDKARLDELIQQVRRQNRAKAEVADDEFEGFGD